ncbi:hypothetical protein AMTRI_Chr07g79010 [Amborella trichopoda]|uniref:putative pentatricopeptide repeat-containing protein At5g08490 n=1 Tax=Amborella trichopoda TaxID=13333 RepID=UPI0009BDAF96|nr:putative pentatricopeptide repeat-containing protein At5g08490 [Amborella trichopoda]XP_020522032.1 putative pentatricopeptide repeat-containing protein At5g08490 [Amborella trichopoda]XP_020522033.1 putative pentatricopeptide repeat-containing protein At5g08490 [Amborella trichopoda]XP_020522034.1 putative pentatricopeptide repeat-containing protein At5g08490 [Amborella trichopoda]XP_020522035.1 putative pentatricopeptide repeat-containing protein At5g08490 [Amborella trichopoda]XP_0205220|eukprot:XP_011622855.2 putative pentatricopeptide repeat-containing protein At5g08490 [Amborella trichopoda]
MKKPAIPNFEITSLFHCKPTPPIKFKSLQNQSNQASKPNNPTSWNSILFSLSLLNQPDEALALFACMHRSGCKPDNYTFHPVLKACTTLSSLHLGKMAHNLVAKLGHGSDEGVSKGLLNLYAKCGASSEASCLFQEMPHRDVVTWNICVSASVQTMRYAEALTLVHEMHESEEMPMPNSITLAVAFTACAKLNALLSSQGLHGYAIKMGFESWTLVANAILSMYSKCQKVLDACKLFDWLPDRDVVSWNAIIAGCAQNGLFEEAFGYFQCMVSGKDQAPNYATIATVLSICAELEGQCEEGEEVHCYVEKVGLVSNSSVANALLSYYSRVEDMEGAERVFREMKWRDIVSWNAVIAGYAQNGWLSKAVEFFRDLLCDGMNPESITIISLLPLCAQLGHVHVGRMIHGLIAMDMGLHDNVAVRNALISFYAKCGETVDAYLTFETMPNRDIISWNTMLATCAQIGEEDKIGSLLNRMIMEGTKPDSVTILSIISFYINPRHGKEVHGYCIRSGLSLELAVGNALLDMYAKCGSVHHAFMVFKNMSEKNVITGNAMIFGFAKNCCPDDAETIFREMRERDLTTWNLMIQLNAENTNPDRAIDLFHDLQNQGMRPDAISIMSILPACACLASMHIVKQCHAYITRSYFSDVCLEGTLLDMYSKCGSIKDAHKLFSTRSKRDMVMFTAMMGGYAMHGHAKDALQVFTLMVYSGIKPDHVVMTTVLTACSHACLIDEGWKHFKSMYDAYGIKPTMEHYACMVDMLARAGHLNEAYEFILSMPCEANANVWGTLLGACKIHGSVELGRLAAYRLFDLEASNTGNYVVLSNIYAANGRWEGVEEVRRLMKQRDLKKAAGCSWIELERRTHIFVVGDTSHPQRLVIYSILEGLDQQMKEPICILEEG